MPLVSFNALQCKAYIAINFPTFRCIYFCLVQLLCIALQLPGQNAIAIAVECAQCGIPAVREDGSDFISSLAATQGNVEQHKATQQRTHRNTMQHSAT